jgi:hypothetical protein
MSKDYDCKWYSAGEVSKLGHPLYLEKTEKLKDFDIELLSNNPGIWPINGTKSLINMNLR